jgi:hypothetical protein
MRRFPQVVSFDKADVVGLIFVFTAASAGELGRHGETDEPRVDARS